MKKTKNISQKKQLPADSSCSQHGGELFQAIEMDSVSVEDRKRGLSIEKVADLMRSIERSHLIQPIMVSSTGRLIAGFHRFAACVRLGWKTIPAIIVQDDHLLNEQREIDENLIRLPLTTLERGEHHKRAQELEELRASAEASGRNNNGERNNFAESAHYTQAAAESLHLSRRSIQQEIRIASLLSPEVRDMLRETPVADRKNDLLSLTRFTGEQQLALALIIKSGVKTLAAALRVYAHREEGGTGLQTLAGEEAACLRAILRFASHGFALEDIPDTKEARAIIEKHKGLSTNIIRTLKSIILRYDSDAHHLHSNPQFFVKSGQHEDDTSETGILDLSPDDVAISDETDDEKSGTQLLPLFQDQPAI